MSGDDRRVLLALADEGLELQRDGEDVMAEVRAEGPLGRELPPCPDDALLRSASEVLDMVFANHALALHAGLDLLAVSWRSERMRDELHRLEGLGRPAIWLETIRAELAEELETPA